MNLHIRTLLVVFIVFAFSAANASAEVMDKEPSLAENWLWSAAGGLLATAAWQWRWWAGLAISSVVLLRLVAVYVELHDPFVGPALRLDAGAPYVTHFYLASTLTVVLNAVGAYVGVRRIRTA